jgi:hypothetical protein
MAFEAGDAKKQLALNDADNPPCPACGKADWVYSPVFTILFGEDLDTKAAEQVEHAARVASVGCRGCGCIRLHDLRMLR